MKNFLIFLIGFSVLLMSGSFEYSTPLAKESNAWIDGTSPIFDYPNDFTFVEVPDPLSGDNPVYKLVTMDEPVVGQTFNDHHFQTELTRVTERGKIRHEYSRFDPFNTDQSMIILHDIDSGDLIVYSTASMPYEQNANLVRTLSTIDEDPRWDPQDPNLIWGLRDFSIVRVNVQTGAETIIKDFSQDTTIEPLITAEPDLYRITMQQEGESSYDKRYWAFILQGTLYEYRARYIFTWDQEQDKVLGVYTVPDQESRIDWIGMSPLGNWVLIGGDWDNGGNLAGLTMANKELNQFHRLDYTTAHSDIGLDVEGNEVIIMQNTRTDYIDLIPIDLSTQPILESGGSYDNTNRTPLIRLFYSGESPLGLNSGIHISCNVSGYCVVSTFIETGLTEQNWFDRTITLARLDSTHSQVFYLAKAYNTVGAYWEETQATITNDGSKVLWASNWGQNVGEERVFLIQLDMPSDWITPGTTTTVLPATTTAESSTTITSGSTTTTTAVCPAGELYGEHSEQAELLRHFRDNILSQSPEGQEIIRLYYELSPAIVQAMRNDDLFRKDVKEIIDGVLGLIRGAE